MKTNILTTLAAVGLLAATLVAPANAQQEKGFFEQAGSETKYAPGDFKPAPDKMETRFGTLAFPGGYPTEETVQKVYDELDLQRATQLYLDMYPALSAHGLLKGWVRDYGMSDTSDIVVMANRLDSTPLILTGNTESLYSFFVLDMKTNGPIVLEVPPGVMGPIDDHNFLFLADVGPTGQDKGKGGKYLILPPGYEGDLPDGYFVVQSPTYMAFSFLRANAATVGFGDKAIKFYRENAKVYPLKTGPRPPRVINGTGVAANTLVPEDGSAFKWIHEIISYEPAEAFGKELLGRVASLGIEKGKPFAPDDRMKQIFASAAEEGVAMSRAIAFENRDANAKVYPNRQWESPYITNNSTFYQNDYINLEARTTFHFTADGITPAMAAQMPEGKGSRYQTTYKDKDGKFLDGNKTYKLNVLPEVPVALFWAVTVYDPWTRSEIQSQPYPSISSQQDPPPVTNADGSIDIYFSNEKPDGIADQNWVKTLPDQGFFVYIRYYGPLKAFNEKTWVPNDVELVPIAVTMAAPLQADTEAESRNLFETAGVKQVGADFKPAPDEIDTNFGTLKFDLEAFPTEETTQKIYDEMDLQRATQAYMDFYPALSVYAIVKSQIRDFKFKTSSDIAVAAGPGWKPSEPFLTGNNSTVYAIASLDLKVDGPTVVEIPPGMYGTANDGLFKFLVDFGFVGPDMGKGGKYLFVPPDFQGETPKGYFSIRSPSYRIWVMMRGFGEVGLGDQAVEWFKQHLKVYPLATGPRPGNYTDTTGMGINPLPPEDGSVFEMLNEIVQYEPKELFGAEQLGRLATLGIAKGKPFEPDDRMRRILDQGARQGVAMSRAIVYASRDPEIKYWPDRHWEKMFLHNTTFERDGVNDIDARTLWHYQAIVVSPNLLSTTPGQGTAYLTAFRDNRDEYLDGGARYRLRVPANPPVKRFWAVTAYDPTTRGLLDAGGNTNRSVGSLDNPEVNADGSVDVFFGPTAAPKGKEKNWVRTDPKKGFFVVFRFYGPLEGYIEKSWVLSDFEKVE